MGRQIIGRKGRGASECAHGDRAGPAICRTDAASLVELSFLVHWVLDQGNLGSGGDSCSGGPHLHEAAAGLGCLVSSLTTSDISDGKSSRK